MEQYHKNGGLLIFASRERLQADIDALAAITDPGATGLTRIGFTEAYRRGAEYIKSRMREIGLTVREDEVGNVYGLLPGSDPTLPVILSGSHLDTVRDAGRFDGIAGVVAALEVARLLKERGDKLTRSFEVVAIIEEEGTRFGRAMLGSQFMAGVLSEADYDLIADAGGVTLRDVLNTHMSGIDACPAKRADDEIFAFLELHDEQGPVLEREGLSIGVVEHIVGLVWLSVTVEGFAGHAGSVPMPGRQDAMMAAAKVISDTRDFVMDRYADTATFTVGQLQLTPGSANTIPGCCQFTMDIRSGDFAQVQGICRFVRDRANEVERAFGVRISTTETANKQPVTMNGPMMELLRESAAELGYGHRSMNSGAGHDAMILAAKWPTAMLFVPCEGGITHNPAEMVSPEDLGKGCDVLYRTILKLDDRNVT